MIIFTSTMQDSVVDLKKLSVAALMLSFRKYENEHLATNFTFFVE